MYIPFFNIIELIVSFIITASVIGVLIGALLAFSNKKI